MTYRDQGLEEALLKRGYDDAAATYVQNCLKFLDEADARNPHIAEGAEYYGRMLQGVERARCDCCGKEIQNVRYREGLILGSECIDHPQRYPCSAQSPSMRAESRRSD